MALIECPDCGKQVSDTAPACIGCGRPLADFAKEQEAVAEKEDEADDGWSEAARKEMARAVEARQEEEPAAEDAEPLGGGMANPGSPESQRRRIKKEMARAWEARQGSGGVQQEEENSALGKCKACGGVVAEQADACPHCGFSFAKEREAAKRELAGKEAAAKKSRGCLLWIGLTLLFWWYIYGGGQQGNCPACEGWGKFQGYNHIRQDKQHIFAMGNLGVCDMCTSYFHLVDGDLDSETQDCRTCGGDGDL